MDSITSRQLDIFKNFLRKWPKTIKKKYKIGLDDEDVNSKIKTHDLDEICIFLSQQLEKPHQPR